jgi:hypothetical protein
MIDGPILSLYIMIGVIVLVGSAVLWSLVP